VRHWPAAAQASTGPDVAPPWRRGRVPHTETNKNLEHQHGARGGVAATLRHEEEGTELLRGAAEVIGDRQLVCKPMSPSSVRRVHAIARPPAPDATTPTTAGRPTCAARPAASALDRAARRARASGGRWTITRTDKLASDLRLLDTQTRPPACYRASWQLPGPDSHRQATTSFRPEHSRWTTTS
jgi:hypothetical protein